MAGFLIIVPILKHGGGSMYFLFNYVYNPVLTYGIDYPS